MNSSAPAVVSAIALLFVSLAVRAQEESVRLIDVTPDMRGEAAKALHGCSVENAKLHGGINKNGVYTLTGDLFDNGRVYAVLDSNPILICEWNHRKWTLKTAINAKAEWKFPGWSRETAPGREPKATRPFSPLKLQGRTLLVIALSEDRYQQNYVVLRFNAHGTSLLDTIHSFGFWPFVKYGYLVTGDNSRNKAEWGATYFSQVRGGKIVQLKTWEEFTPYNQPGPEEYEGDVFCYGAESRGTEYTIMPDYGKGAHPADFVVFKGELQRDGWRSILDARNERQTWAKLYFATLRKDAESDLAEKEMAYIFSKLTGLPRDLYRITDEYRQSGKVEKEARIKIEGSQDAISLLSP